MSYELTVERLIDAMPDVVFDAFVDPDAQTVLYDDETDATWTVESELDLRVGGTWTIAFGKAGEDPYRETNVFSEVDRPRRIAFDSSMFMIDDRRTVETTVTVTFEDRDGQDAPDDRPDRLRTRTGPRRHPGRLVQHPGRPRARRRRQTSHVRRPGTEPETAEEQADDQGRDARSRDQHLRRTGRASTRWSRRSPKRDRRRRLSKRET